MPKKAMMIPGPRAPDATRRRLLSGGALTVAASAALIAGRGQVAAEEQAPPADPKQPTYRVTDHIAAYYRRARD